MFVLPAVQVRDLLPADQLRPIPDDIRTLLGDYALPLPDGSFVCLAVDSSEEDERDELDEGDWEG